MAWEEAKRRAEEECRAQEEAARGAKEEAKRKEREDAMQKARGAVEAQADKELRLAEERLWEEAVGGWLCLGLALLVIVAPEVLALKDPCARCSGKGIHCVLSVAKGKTMLCEVCDHVKVSCSWSKKTVNEKHKQKRVQHSEEAEEAGVIDVDKDEDEEEQLHFMVPAHLAEDHWGALRALMTTLDTLSTNLHAFWQDSWEVSIKTLRLIVMLHVLPHDSKAF
ncbi:hypothetical protein ID866_10544 [Astraeus odoratus]|nr:hypothetical protein ID866_10544 [Astraeus odoratus]